MKLFIMSYASDAIIDSSSRLAVELRLKAVNHFGV
jgi:hypothetical protein